MTTETTQAVANLGSRIPEVGFSDDEEAMEVFLEWVADRGITLYPAQEEAVLEIFAGNHVILKTPTGSGKSLVAIAMQFRAFARAQRSVYTAPIKALVSEKFFALCEVFGAEWVGMMTGDGVVNEDAPIMCCTAEILSMLALRHGDETRFRAVVMDEFHYYGDRDRGMAWQVPLLRMSQARFLLMSATLGLTRDIEADLEERTGAMVAVVRSASRPVPLSWEYSTTPMLMRLSSLVGAGRHPVYAVHFSQRAATDLAQSLLSTDMSSAEDKKVLKDAVRGFRFDSPYGPSLRRMLLHGVAVHHAGLLPKYRLLVEKLSQRGLFKVICGTDTLGVGINVPIRSVFFTQLCKFDGEEVRILSVRSFQQIAGRAGRKGFDDEGSVVVQAPDWVIENARLKAAVDRGEKKKKKTVFKKAPTRGYKHWDQDTFERLVKGLPEELESRFRVDHGLILALLRRAEETGGDGIAELRELIEASHSSQRARAAMQIELQQQLEALLQAGVVTQDGEDGPLRVHEDLQEDFSLHHSLSLFLLHAIGKLDVDAPDYALDVVTMVEAILEHPKTVLFAQQRRAKGELIAELKAQGMPYEERMELVEQVTWPKPRAPWIYETFNAYAETRPWLAGDPIRPKSIVREMLETQAVFSTFVKGLGLERAEGVLLRYLTQVYKALVQNVPLEARTTEVYEAIGYLRAMLARVDDSLVSSWEAMLEPTSSEAAPAPTDISADSKAFRARVRAELHAVLRALSTRDWEEAAASVRQVEGWEWEAADFERAMQPYFEEFGDVNFFGPVRQAWNTHMEQLEPHRWKVSQRLDDDEENGWSIQGEVDLTADTNPSGPIVQMVAIKE